MLALESLKQNILTECEEDHVGLWSVIREVEESLPMLDQAAVRDQVLTLLHELLMAHEIRAGYPMPDGRFRSLHISPEKVMDQIDAEWPVGHPPTIGEGLWFTSAKKTGKSVKDSSLGS
jgi:hypothetical protein